MGNVKSTLNGTITAVDVETNQPITKSIGSPQLDSAVGELSTYQLAPTSGADYVVTLPAATVYCVYIRNRAAAGSGQNLTIKVTPSGGAQATVGLLPPGGVFAYWTTVVGTGGLTGVSINPSANNIPFDIYIGA